MQTYVYICIQAYTSKQNIKYMQISAHKSKKNCNGPVLPVLRLSVLVHPHFLFFRNVKLMCTKPERCVTLDSETQ